MKNNLATRKKKGQMEKSRCSTPTCPNGISEGNYEIACKMVVQEYLSLPLELEKGGVGEREHVIK